MKNRKRLSSIYVKYAIFTMLVLGVAGIGVSAFYGLFVPVGVMLFFLVFVALLFISIFNDVYYDKEYVYLKKYYRKDFNKFALNEIQEIDQSMLTGLYVIVINGDYYRFQVTIWHRFKKDLLGYIKRQ